MMMARERFNIFTSKLFAQLCVSFGIAGAASISVFVVYSRMSGVTFEALPTHIMLTFWLIVVCQFCTVFASAYLAWHLNQRVLFFAAAVWCCKAIMMILWISDATAY
jgi:hypothetical protein